MPGLDGFAVCEILKANPETEHIPIIFLTAKGETETLRKAFRIRAVDYIRKPFHSDELLARIGNQARFIESEQDKSSEPGNGHPCSGSLS